MSPTLASGALKVSAMGSGVGAAEASPDASVSAGGWLLREAGAPGLDGFGDGPPNTKLMRRVLDAFDPNRKLSPGRLSTEGMDG